MDSDVKEFLVYKYKQLTGIEAGHWSISRLKREIKNLKRRDQYLNQILKERYTKDD